MRKNIFFLLFSILIFIGFNSCKQLEGTKVAKFYHNVTARFNGYFNAKEKMLEVEARLFESHPDNYNTILNVFADGDEQTAKSVTGDLEIILKKASTVIQKHPTSNWIDDSYFLIAKSHFYKRDYFAALETFEYIQSRYDKSEPGQEAPLWIIRTYLKMDKPNEAQARISALNLNKKVTKEIKEKLRLVEAEYFIETEQYDRAAEQMELAMPNIKGKKYKARYSFILAQLYQKLGNNPKATNYYKAVIKKNPVYELAFQAKIGLADVSDDKAEVASYLKKLTKDEKNLSYNDQIYYVLAKSELKDNNIPAAIDYLKQSLASSQKNRNQKALSYLMLADIYFAQPNYPYSKAYYDSAAKIVDKTYPGYENFKNRQEMLSELIENLIIIENEDSLQRLARLSEPELKAHIQQIIDAERRRAEESLVDNSTNVIQNQPIQNSAFNDFSIKTKGNSSGVLFTDPSWLARGSSEFLARWGRRPLSDDWRRKDKPVSNTQNPNNPIDTFITNTIRKDTAKFDNPNRGVLNTYVPNVPADQARYYQEIPFTTTQKNISNIKLQEALFSVGNIYYQRLNEPKKAIIYYEDLLKRFPNTKHLLPTRYNLYRIYMAEGNPASAEVHKQYILKNFPGTDYAQLIENPDQLRDKYAKRNKNEALEDLYEKTYAAFKANNCGTVAMNKDEANRTFKNYLQAKFEYLNVICQYRSDSTGLLLDSLKSFTKKFPGDEVTKQAVNLIEFLENKKKTSLTGYVEPKKVVDKPIANYEFDDGLPHFYILIYPADASETIVKTNFSNRNTNKYGKLELDMTSTLLTDTNQMIVIRNFKTFSSAYSYMDDLRNDPVFYKDLNLKSYKAFMISDANYRALVKTKDIAGYEKFYQSFY